MRNVKAQRVRKIMKERQRGKKFRRPAKNKIKIAPGHQIPGPTSPKVPWVARDVHPLSTDGLMCIVSVYFGNRRISSAFLFI
jgi:hypothetical protein